jgi:glycosyltransferase involved in cell wall biosynthesis
MSNQRISVAMCTYNGARFLPEQLESIAAQIRPPYEIIICDDCSTDNTVEIINSFAERARFFVRLEVNESNLGVTKNFEKAIELCQGEIVALSDQDDIWRPQKLEHIAKTLAQEPGCLLVFSDGNCIDGDGLDLGFTLWDKCGEDNVHGLLRDGYSQLGILLKREIVTGATLAVRRRLLEKALPIPDIWLHDAWLAIVAAATDQIAVIDERLIQYRVHGSQYIGVGRRKLREEVRSKIGRSKLQDLKRFQVLKDFLYSKLSPDLQRDLSSKIKHLETRSSLSPGAFKRLTQIGREASTGRYHRFSSGLLSMILDVIGS